MKYDFNTMLKRNGKDAVALDGVDWLFQGKGQIKEGFSPIPMWIADMNFCTVPTIPQTVQERVEHPAYGYFLTRDEYFEKIIHWHKFRNGIEGISKEHIGYENGVLGGITSALRLLSAPGDSILLHSPTYIGFTHTLEDNGYHIVLSSLRKDENDIWRMDYEDMERKIRENKIHTAIFCSPHNPTGRVWERWEIKRAMEIYKKYDVYVISDEIWSDIVLYGNHHIPTQAVSEDARNRTIAFYAPSKTFNLAGLIGSYRIVYNSRIREQLDKIEAAIHYNSINILSMYALIGAYTPEGMEWVNELCETIEGNMDFACGFVSEYFDGVECMKPQGTYMLLLDCEKYCKKTGKTIDEIFVKGLEVGVLWQDGRPFHGEYTIRMNLALPLDKVKDAFKRLEEYVF